MSDDKYTQEKKSGLIDAITKAFDRFVGTFRKHGVAVVTFILVLFMLLYCIVLNPIRVGDIIDETIHRQDRINMENRERHVQQRLEADKLLLQIMNTVVADFNVDRCMIFEAHNTNQNLSKIPFLYLSCTSEVLPSEATDGHEIDYIADSFSHQYISNFIGETVFNRLIHENYLYFNNLENYSRNTYRFVNKMRDFGSHSLMIIPFVSDNIPLVLMVISSRADEIPAQKIYDYVKNFRGEIERNLMNVE